MNISAEEKNHYLREAEVVLAREGFQADRTHAGSLRVLLDGVPLCGIPESGGITYEWQTSVRRSGWPPRTRSTASSET